MWLLHLVAPALACQPNRRPGFFVFPAPAAELPANGRVVIKPLRLSEPFAWEATMQAWGLLLRSGEATIPLVPMIVPDMRLPVIFQPEQPPAPGAWALASATPFDAPALDALFETEIYPWGNVRGAIAEEVEPWVEHLPWSGWAFRADADTTPPT